MTKALTLEQFREYFWRRVDRSGGPDACWPWTRGRHSYGYGVVNSRLLPHPMPTHRVAFWLEYGRWPVPAGRHTYDNPPCCNPVHIIEGTQAQNMRDCIERGRFRIGGRTRSTWTAGDTFNRRTGKRGGSQ